MAVKRFRDDGEEETELAIQLHSYRVKSFREDEEGEIKSDVRMFECKTCNRAFPSFQALGGHRASHKKPRLMKGLNHHNKEMKHKTHECSICGLQFAMGQALGGHMRRHRNMTCEAKEPHNLYMKFPAVTKSSKKCFDYNLPDLNLPFEEDSELEEVDHHLRLFC